MSATPTLSASRAITLLVLAGCVIALLSFGVRASFGLFTAPVSEAQGWSREVFALAIALQNLFWGIGQPLAGALVDRFGVPRVLVVGGLIYASGTALMAFVSEPWQLHLTAGVMVGLGMAGASYITVLAALGRMVPAERRSWALGLGTAAGSLGQFLIAPLGQAFISAYGWEVAAVLLASLVALIPLLSRAFSGAGLASGPADGVAMPLGRAVRLALAEPAYLFLMVGFFVCGFHIGFITVHWPADLTDRGFSADIGGLAIALIGLFNVIGAYSAGILGARYHKAWMLSLIYALRAVLMVAYVMLPPSLPMALVFAVAMGLLWFSTIPPTSGLVATLFGPRYMGTLFGLVFFSHQIGAFLGIWLAGQVFAESGNYDLMWWIAAGIGVVGAVVNLPIPERRVAAFAAKG